MTKIARDPAEYEALVREQLRFLGTYGQLFDAGDASWAKPIAVALRVLLHTGGSNSHALLQQSGHLASLRFYDSAGELDLTWNLIGNHPMAITRLTTGGGEGPGEARYVPPLDDGPPPMRYSLAQQVAAFARGQKLPRAAGFHLPFKDWWNAVAIRDSTNTDFTRKDLIRALANEDGGAHVDPALTATHHALARSNSLGWAFNDGVDHEEKAMGSPIPASVRQIAYEVERTIRQQAPGLMP